MAASRSFGRAAEQDSRTADRSSVRQQGRATRQPATTVRRLQRTLGNSGMKRLAAVQRQEHEEEGEQVQTSRTMPAVQRTLGSRVGADLSGVRAHTDAESNHLSRVAFTTGQNIFFRAGAHDPASEQGMHLPAHEASMPRVQRRVDQIPRSAALLSQAPAELFGANPYEKTLETIDSYYAANATDYGRQLIWLKTLKGNIATWEGEHGPVNTAPPKRLLGASRDDKRHIALKTVNDALPQEQTGVQDQGFNDAMGKHNADRAKLQEYLTAAETSGERRLSNSAQWVKAGKAALYAVTPTGDSAMRLTLAGKNPARDEAFFPKGLRGAAGHIQEAASPYNKADPADNANVMLDEEGKSTGGWNVPGVISIVRPATKTQDTVWETLRHEVQHDADKNKGREARAGVRKAAEQYDTVTGTAQKNAAAKLMDTEVALSRYKTEYRAYSYQGSADYARLDNSARNKTNGGVPFTERQLAIFQHIYSGYKYTKDEWDANSSLSGGATIKHAVSDYYLPDTEGMNAHNSPRVDDFYKALDAVGTKQAATANETGGKRLGDIAPVDQKVAVVTDPGVQALLVALKNLHGDDADYIVNESPDMLKKIRNHLEGAALNKVMEEINDMASFSKLATISLFD